MTGGREKGGGGGGSEEEEKQKKDEELQKLGLGAPGKLGHISLRQSHIV